jgi:predicted HAD superfamily Cof-like phosphohydrolase
MKSNQLRDIHNKMGTHEAVSRLSKDKLHKFILFRAKFLEEELNELLQADNAEDIIDALIDISYVAIGTLDLFNVDIDKAWDRVHKANMSKIAGVKATRPNEFNLPDLVKPEGWTAPTHSDNLGDFEHIDDLPINKHETESVNVLKECVDLQRRKSQDYQNPKSGIKQAMHYRRGIDSIHDLIWGKIIRAQSLLESGNNNIFESLEDTYLDMANYCSFAISYLRKRMNGQDPNKNIFNQDEKDVHSR